jgi:hypothetical protein
MKLNVRKRYKNGAEGINFASVLCHSLAQFATPKYRRFEMPEADTHQDEEEKTGGALTDLENDLMSEIEGREEEEDEPLNQDGG